MKNNAVALEKKKEKTFRIKDLSKWDLCVEDMKKGKQLINDKEAAYKAMFHKETQELFSQRDNYFFLINQ